MSGTDYQCTSSFPCCPPPGSGQRKGPLTKAGLKENLSPTWFLGNVTSVWGWLHICLDSFEVRVHTTGMSSYLSLAASPGFLCASQRQVSPLLHIPSRVHLSQPGCCQHLPTCLLRPQAAPNHLSQKSHTNAEASLGSDEKFKAKEDQTNTNFFF